MKKQLIATLVGGILLFVWQFLSWSLLGVHASEMQYTASQDQIMESLTAANLDQGTYFLPNVSPDLPQDQHQAEMEKHAGKPWAVISYHHSLNMGIGMNMFRGLVADLLAAFLLVWVLMKIPGLDFRSTLMASLAVGLVGYLAISYLNSVWFETRSIGHLIDAIVQWGLVGAWLGWWLPRE